jgi:hypothetical protein
MNIQYSGDQPGTEFVQKDPRQKKGVIKNRCGLEALCHQPADLKDVLVQPMF